jgi:hypothetical protein
MVPAPDVQRRVERPHLELHARSIRCRDPTRAARFGGSQRGKRRAAKEGAKLFGGTRGGGLGLLRDLHDLYLMATECEVTGTLVAQAGQLRWLRTRMKQAAPQALVVAD